MSLLWAVPPVAVAVAAVIVLMALDRMAEAANEVALQLRHLDEVRVAVAELRAEASTTRAQLRSLRAR
jgi:uncharacterized coiled-coil protein SlyX